MVRKIDWENQIGRRLRLRDLHIFLAVAEHGSMTKAGRKLRVSQPAVSAVIADLEHTIGVPLVDRSARGVELTIYGRELIERSRTAFDELKQGIRTIEFLADPTVGNLRIGCAESIASGLLAPIIERFSMQYPGIVLEVHTVSPSLQASELNQRSLDLFISRPMMPLTDENDDLNTELLFDDAMVLAVGSENRWAGRRKIDLAELADDPWITAPRTSRFYMILAEAFSARGLAMPKICLMTFSIHLRVNLLATGHFISAFPWSVLRLYANRFALKALPVDLPVHPWPVAIITLKNRTLNPVAQLFINYVRAFVKSLSAEPNGP